jgi:hypothetical protein
MGKKEDKSIISVRTDAWREAKMFCAEFGGTIKNFVSDVIQDEVRKRRKEERSKRKEAA